MPDAFIKVEKLHCHIGSQRTLRIASFSLAPGQHWCFFGGNGSGKTMIAELLSGRLRYAGARVSYAPGFDPGSDICEVSFEEQQRLCALDNRYDISEFTESAQDTGTTVGKLVCGNQPADEAALLQIMAQLGIAELREQGIRFLSSGQIRRAMIARAFYRNPRLIVLDNPLESIDRDSAQQIRTALNAWMGAANCVLLLCRRAGDILPGITHMALLKDLQIVAQGSLQAILRSKTFRAMAERSPEIPEVMPEPCPGHSLLQLDAGTALISLQGVNVSYGARPVFKSLWWEMRRGDHILIEGENGSGKSTLLSLISGENHKAYSQPVYLFGRLRGTGESVWDIKAHFGIVSNELHNRYIKGWRVLDVVVSGFFDTVGLYDDCGASEIDTALAWLQVMGLQELSSGFYHELSFGQQRLTLLARAMVKQPNILILDEPCVGLDDYHRHLLLGILDRVADGGKTHVIYVSHTEEEFPDCVTQRLSLSRTAEDQGAVVEITQIAD
jgi:molybdate transport system ATP-binding protein